VSWSLRFAEPIVLADGAKLATLRQAIAHLVKTIPAAERGSPAVLAAAELLTNAAEHGGPVEFARIATLQALNRNAERAFNPERKDPHWGRRKLKRDTA
jgi:anti-sigma regulatory factor (Ser/Thr protein kinase)